MREYEVDNKANRNSRSPNEAEKKNRASRVQPWPGETPKMLIFIPNRRLQEPMFTTEIKLKCINALWLVILEACIVTTQLF